MVVRTVSEIVCLTQLSFCIAGIAYKVIQNIKAVTGYMAFNIPGTTIRRNKRLTLLQIPELTNFALRTLAPKNTILLLTRAAT